MPTDSLFEMRKFVVPEMVFGVGAIDLVGQYANNIGARKILVVSDEGVRDAGWVIRVTRKLDTEGFPWELFTQVTPNPRSSEVMRGVEVYRAGGCDAIVAVGGGSPMDCAKGIGIVAAAGGHVLDYEGVDKIPVPIAPLICIPTTAGSAADISQFCIVTDESRRLKIAIVSKAVVPDVALIDPQTTTTMDANLTAATGLDALTHAIEAYVSTANAPMTDLHALRAVGLIASHLTNTIRDPLNLHLRFQLMLASTHAGMAFSNAILGAVHAMAHSLGGFLDLPHGECNAILLEHVVGFNFAEVPGRYRDIAQAMGLELGRDHQETLDNLLAGLRTLRIEAGVTKTLSQLGVDPASISQLAAKASADACLVTNPRPADQADIEGIYAAAL